MAAEEPLTTKEGWRRFADHQTVMPELPSTAALAAMTVREREEHDEARRAYHADLPLANTPVIQRGSHGAGAQAGTGSAIMGARRWARPVAGSPPGFTSQSSSAQPLDFAP